MDNEIRAASQEPAGENDAELGSEALWKALTPRQRKFVTVYEQHGNGTRAAEAAGCAEKSAPVQASRWLKNDKVLAYLRTHATEILNARGIDKDNLTNRTFEIFTRCMDAVPHMTWNADTREYEPDGTWVFDAKNALKAVEMMGKTIGMYRDEVNVHVGSVEEYLKALGENKVEY